MCVSGDELMAGTASSFSMNDFDAIADAAKCDIATIRKAVALPGPIVRVRCGLIPALTISARVLD